MQPHLSHAPHDPHTWFSATSMPQVVHSVIESGEKLKIRIKIVCNFLLFVSRATDDGDRLTFLGRKHTIWVSYSYIFGYGIYRYLVSRRSPASRRLFCPCRDQSFYACRNDGWIRGEQRGSSVKNGGSRFGDLSIAWWVGDYAWCLCDLRGGVSGVVFGTSDIYDACVLEGARSNAEDERIDQFLQEHGFAWSNIDVARHWAAVGVFFGDVILAG